MKNTLKPRKSRAWPLAYIAVVAFCILVGFAGFIAYRGVDLGRIIYQQQSQIRHLIENGGTIGVAPASSTFSVGYLTAIFGDNPELLNKLTGVVQQGLSDAPALQLGEVSSMLVTYHLGPEEKAENVVIHLTGGFPLIKRKPQLHPDGFFYNQLDKDLWETANGAVSILGRDLVMFAEENVQEEQRKLLETILNGEILPLVDWVEANPIYFTLVLPNPENIIPRQLRQHMQATVLKGHLSTEGGRLEAIFLTPSDKSAVRTYNVLRNFRVMAEATLMMHFGGELLQKDWGPYAPNWWAHELIKTSRKASLERKDYIVTLESSFGRVMSNIVLKTVERLGRDIAQMRGIMGKGMDPRLVDAELKSAKPLHYWSDAHRWGPNWPFPAKKSGNPPETGTTNTTTSASAGLSETEDPAASTEEATAEKI